MISSEFSLEKYLAYEKIAQDIALYFHGQIKAIPYLLQNDDFWNEFQTKENLIAIDFKDVRREDCHDVLCDILVNFDISYMRGFYFYMSKKYQMEVIFMGCDELTNDFYCMYDKSQNLYHGYMTPSDTEDYEEFIISGSLEDK